MSTGRLSREATALVHANGPNVGLAHDLSLKPTAGRYRGASTRSADRDTPKKDCFALPVHMIELTEDLQPPAGLARLVFNPSSDHNRGAKQIGRGVRPGPLCWHQQRPRTKHIGTNYFRRAHL
jgi:hypothetical protein